MTENGLIVVMRIYDDIGQDLYRANDDTTFNMNLIITKDGEINGSDHNLEVGEKANPKLTMRAIKETIEYLTNYYNRLSDLFKH